MLWVRLGIVGLFAAACSGPQWPEPPRPDHRQLLQEPPPPAVLPPEPPENADPPESTAPELPSCGSYCLDVGLACTGERAVYASAEECLKRCRSADWVAGSPGDTTGNSLACRATWAAKAVSDTVSGCTNAAFASLACSHSSAVPSGTVTAPPLDEGAMMVLGLFDATDGGRAWAAGRRARDEILRFRVGVALKKLGLGLTILDLSKGGLPDDALLRSARAIVTCFYDASLPNAAAYATWLRAQIDAGRRVVILNDYGAYQDSTTQAWVDEGEVNLPLEALGVHYDGQWTRDARKLRVKASDKAVFRGGVPSPKRAQHYYRFMPVAPDLTVHLLVERTDIPSGESAVVFTGPRGGMAFTRYYESRDGLEYVDLTKLLSRALGIAAP